jgi:hypothetical protein
MVCLQINGQVSNLCNGEVGQWLSIVLDDLSLGMRMYLTTLVATSKGTAR